MWQLQNAISSTAETTCGQKIPWQPKLEWLPIMQNYFNEMCKTSIEMNI